MRLATIALLPFLFLLPLSASAQAEERDASVPISSLVLFTSGVGYFQHDGVVEGNARMELTFSASQINDLLKSLVLRDLDGGTISSVTYSSRDPITRTLKSFSIDLTTSPTMASLLTQTRGEAVEVLATGGNRINGTIISVEERIVQSGPKGDVPGDFLNLNTASGITTIALADVQGIRYLRKEVQDDLAQALQVLSTSHGIEKKKVVLHFSGTGKRRVRIGYIVESPVWKTSYRLVLADTGQHLLQGWAMVENTSDTDWKNVALTLVSGRPITFVMDLYQPLYIQRPEVQLELYQSLRPRTNQMAMEQQAEDDESAAMAEEAPSGAPAAKSLAAPAPAQAQRASAGEARSSDAAGPQGVAAVASGTAVGDLFQYVIEKPVALPRQTSALLPILNQQVGGERYSLFNESTDPKHPLNAVKLKNASSLHLMQGPITVFDGGTYAGDAQITDLAPGAEQLVTYAMDLDSEVEALPGPTPVSLVSVRISKGVFFTTSKQQRERVYTVKNRGEKKPHPAHRASLSARVDTRDPQGGDGTDAGRVPLRPSRNGGEIGLSLRGGDPDPGAERRTLKPRGRPGRLLRAQPGGEHGGEECAAEGCRPSAEDVGYHRAAHEQGDARERHLQRPVADPFEHGQAFAELRAVQALRENPERRRGRAGPASRGHRQAP